MGKAKTQNNVVTEVKVVRRLPNYTIKEYSRNGIVVRTLETSTITFSPKAINDIIDQIEEGNRWIKDPAYQVTTCLITVVRGSQYFQYLGKPIIVLSNEEATPATAAHEMGHPIFDYYRNSPKAPNEAALKVVDLYLQLSDTRKIPGSIIFPDRQEQVNLPAGLWFSDPPNWSKNRLSEHPEENADELFASTREAYLLNKTGLQNAIKKFSKHDPKVTGPATGLIALIGALKNNESIGKTLSAMSRQKATEALKKIEQALTLETSVTFNSHGGALLRLTADPDNAHLRSPRLFPAWLSRPFQHFGTKTTEWKTNRSRNQQNDILNKQFEKQRTGEQRLREQRLREQQLREQQVREQRAREQRLGEQGLREQQLRERQLRDQLTREQQMREQRLREQQIREQQMRQQQLRDQQLREERRQQQLREQQLREQKTREQQQAAIRKQNQNMFIYRPQNQFIPKTTYRPPLRTGTNYQGTMFAGLFQPYTPPIAKPVDYLRRTWHENTFGKGWSPWERRGE